MDTKKLRQKILDLAIHGKLVPQDPNDEPASVLLERIRAEKEQLIKEGKIKAPKKSKTAGDTSHYPKEGPWELPEGWCWTTLGSVCHIAGRIGFRGYTKTDLVKENGAITLSPSNIIDGIMNFSHYTMISWEKYYESPEIQVRVGDILLVKTGSSYGKAALVDTLPLQSTINPQFVVLKHILCDNSYLIHLLQSGYAKKLYDAFVLGTAIPTFTQAALNEMLVPLPPLPEQRRIVTAINKWNNHIFQVDKAEHDLQIIVDTCKAKVLDLAIHGKLVPQDPNNEPAIELLKRINPTFQPSDNLHYEEYLPEGWCIAPLSSFCTTINGLWKGNKEPLLNVGVIRNANFTKDFGLDYSKIEYIDVELKSFEKRNLEDGDIIVEKSGGSDNFPVGRSILFNGESRKYSFSNFTMSLRILDKSLIRPMYLYYVLQHKYRRGDMKQMQTQTTGLHNLLIDKYLSAPIPIPPLGEQERIILSIESLFQTVDGIRNLVKEGE